MTPFFHSEERQAQLIFEAFSWLETPFSAHSRTKGAGVDCVNLAAAIYLRCGVLSSFDPPNYTLGGSHLEISTVETYIAATGAFQKLEISQSPSIILGDLLAFRMGKVVHHVGIMLAETEFIHVFQGMRVKFNDLRDHTWFKRLVRIYRPIETPLTIDNPVPRTANQPSQIATQKSQIAN